MFKAKLTLLAMLFVAAQPAAAQETQIATHDTVVEDGTCAHVTAPGNIARIAETFRALPQSTRKNLQHVLLHAGLYFGDVDGLWGEQTQCGMIAVAHRFDGEMSDASLIGFYEYMLFGGFMLDYEGTPNGNPHLGALY